MPPEPVVTALVPVHEFSPEFLRAALASLQSQTDPNWRALVIVEPGRRGSTATVMEPQLADQRIQVIENAGRGLPGAFNTGMSATDTEFVSILLADDLWAPETVAVLVREIDARPGVDFFHSARRVIDETGASISSVHRATPNVTLADFELRAPVKHLLCWRRGTGLAAGGMDESLNSVGPDDLDFPWTMAEYGATFGAIDECLYLYRDHRADFRLTTHLPRSVHRRELARIFRKHGLPDALAANASEKPPGPTSSSACTDPRSRPGFDRQPVGLRRSGGSTIAEVPEPRSTMPVVTVILPTFERADLLASAIKSVLCQTFDDWEVLVVDDASDADIAAVVGGFQDPRLRYVRRSVNGGVSAAQNAGLDLARGSTSRSCTPTTSSCPRSWHGKSRCWRRCRTPSARSNRAWRSSGPAERSGVHRASPAPTGPT